MNALGKVYQKKEIGWKQIILAAFVNDAQISIALRAVISQNAIDFMHFQRRRVLGIINANGERR